MNSLTVIETHPVQYHAPVYRALQERHHIAVTVIYGSDFSVAGYHDREFDSTFAWDTDLLSGYRSVFLSRVSTGGSRSLDEISARGLGRALQEVRAGPTLLLGYSPMFHQAAFVQTWRTGRPMLFRADTADHTHPRGVVKSALRDQILRRLYSACARLLYAGQNSQRHFRRLGVPDSKLVFSPYCVDTSCFRDDEASRERLRQTVRRDLNVAPADFVVLFSGKLSRWKGVDLLLAAVKTLPAPVREKAVILFLGNGELRLELEAQAANAPIIRTHFCGFKNQTQLSPYYHAADLLTLPSHSETWGLVVNEALHHGLPCVVSRSVGCAPDLVEPGVTGEIAETDSIESLAEAIVRALPLVERAEVRNACLARVSGYTVERAAAGIAEAYQAVVN